VQGGEPCTPFIPQEVQNTVKSGKMGYERKRKFLFDSSDFHLFFLLVHLEWKYFFIKILKTY